MRRRTALQLGSIGASASLAGCASLQGYILGKIPKEFEIRNDRQKSVEVDVEILADDEVVLEQVYQVEAQQTITDNWPSGKAEQFRIEARVPDDWVTFTFNPSDWDKRHTPVVHVSDAGIGVFVD